MKLIAIILTIIVFIALGLLIYTVVFSPQIKLIIIMSLFSVLVLSGSAWFIDLEYFLTMPEKNSRIKLKN